MKITVLGAGNIGGTMGTKWAEAGHEVVFGVRDAASPKVKALLKNISGNGRADSIANALAFGEVVLVAIPYDAVAATVAAHADRLAGKIIIDASNKFGAPVVNNLETIRQAVPTAQLFRAFNSLGWEVFANPQLGNVQVDRFYCCWDFYTCYSCYTRQYGWFADDPRGLGERDVRGAAKSVSF